MASFSRSKSPPEVSPVMTESCPQACLASGRAWRPDVADMLAATLAAAACACVAWRMLRKLSHDTYAEPIAGMAALLGEAKAPDIAAFYAFTITFAAILLWRVWRRRNDEAGVRRRRPYLQMLTGPGSVSTLRTLDSAWRRIPSQYAIAAPSWLHDLGIFALCSLAAGVSAGVAWSRGGWGAPVAATRLVWALWLGVCLCGSLFMFVALARACRPQRAAIILCVQLVIPFAAFAVLPPPTLTALQEHMPYVQKPAAITAVWSIIGLCYAMFAAQVVALRRQGMLWARPRLISGAWLGFVLFISTAAYAADALHYDDFHLGEMLLPWQQWRDFGSVPYVNLIPSHGMVQFVDGWLGDWLFDGSVAATVNGARLLHGLSCVLFFVTLANLVGCGAALALMLAFACVPMVPERTFFLQFAFVLAFADPRLVLRPRLWTACWLGLAPFFALSNLVQGTACVIGSLALWPASIRQLTAQRGLPHAALWLLGTSVLLGLVALASGFDAILIGAFAHLKENASINAVAFGIPLAFVRERSLRIIWGGILTNWQMLWIPCAALLGAGAWRFWGRQNVPSMRRLAPIWAAVAMAALVLHGYALGRIDPSGTTRLGFVTTFMLGMVLPVSALMAWHRRHAGRAALCLGLLVLVWGGMGGVRNMLQRTWAMVGALTQPEGRNNGLTEESMRLRGVLARMLRPDETYLDLTNRNANYFYTGRRAALSVGAYYNAAGASYQRHVLEAMQKNGAPPAVLISPHMLLDGLSSSIRVPVLWHYLAERYVPLQVDGFTFFVTPELASRMGHASINSPSGGVPELSESDFVSLDGLLYREDLAYLPASWGRSLRRMLERELKVEWQPVAAELKVADAKQAADGTWHGESDDSHMYVNLDGRKGTDLPYMAFDLQCSADDAVEHDAPFVELVWHSSGNQPVATSRIRFRHKNGRMLVPLGSCPRWLFEHHLEALSMRIPCKDWQVHNIEFLKHTT